MENKKVILKNGQAKVIDSERIKMLTDFLRRINKEGITKDLLEVNQEKIKANYILGLESTSSRMFSNAKSVLFKNRVTTQEEVIEKVDRINMEDIDFVLKECFGSGVLNTSYVGQNVEADKLNSIILDSDKAYNNKNKFGKIEI